MGKQATTGRFKIINLQPGISRLRKHLRQGASRIADSLTTWDVVTVSQCVLSILGLCWRWLVWLLVKILVEPKGNTNSLAPQHQLDKATQHFLYQFPMQLNQHVRSSSNLESTYVTLRHSFHPFQVGTCVPHSVKLKLAIPKVGRWTVAYWLEPTPPPPRYSG